MRQDQSERKKILPLSQIRCQYDFSKNSIDSPDCLFLSLDSGNGDLSVRGADFIMEEERNFRAATALERRLSCYNEITLAERTDAAL